MINMPAGPPKQLDLHVGPPKKEGRVFEKIKDRGNRLDTVRDMRRVTIVCDTLKQIREMSRWIVEESGYDVRRYKLGFDPEYEADEISGGYRDYQICVSRRGTELPGGLILEIQLHLRAIYDIKSEGGISGHKLYKQYRNLAEPRRRELRGVEKELAEIEARLGRMNRAEADFANGEPEPVPEPVPVPVPEPACAAAPADVMFSLRYKDPEEERAAASQARSMQQALEARGISAYICDVGPGQDFSVEIAEKIKTCKLAVIMGTATYGRKTEAVSGTFEELRMIMYRKVPVFLVKMCIEWSSRMSICCIKWQHPFCL